MFVSGVRMFPFEQKILRSVGESLEQHIQKRYEAQVASINKIQRLIEWNEIEFYCMRFLKVRWPEAVLFEDKGGFILASGILRAGSMSAEFTVWSVNGHLFSIESPIPLKPFRQI